MTNRCQFLVPVLGALVLLSALAAPRVFAQGAGPVVGPTQPQGISVLGEGIVIVQPTIGRITLGVEVFDASLARAQAEAATRMETVVLRLKAHGLQDADIRTVSFSINPQYDSRAAGESFLRGYQVQNLVEARTTNVPGLGTLLDEVVASGATRVFGIRFEADEMQRLKDLARDQAMQNARAKAEQLARAAGSSLGRVVYIEESDPGGVTPLRVDAREAAAPAVAARTPIQPGETQIRTVVRVVWALQ